MGSGDRENGDTAGACGDGGVAVWLFQLPHVACPPKALCRVQGRHEIGTSQTSLVGLCCHQWRGPGKSQNDPGPQSPGRLGGLGKRGVRVHRPAPQPLPLSSEGLKQMRSCLSPLAIVQTLLPSVPPPAPGPAPLAHLPFCPWPAPKWSPKWLLSDSMETVAMQRSWRTVAVKSTAQSQAQSHH